MESLPQTETLKLWSVTTLIKQGLGVGEPLVNWAANVTAAHAVDKYALLGRMISEDGRDEAVHWLAERRRRETKRAQDRGTEVHRALEAIALGETPKIPAEIAPYVKQGVRWMERFQPTFVMAEAPVYNLEHRYAGTLDGIVELAGLRLVVDWKTTEHGPDWEKRRPPYPEVALQLCAYSRCTEVGLLRDEETTDRGRYYKYDPTATREPMPEVDGALAIVISPEDCRAVPASIGDLVWTAFLHVQQAARWQTEISKNVLKPPLEVPPTGEEEA